MKKIIILFITLCFFNFLYSSNIIRVQNSKSPVKIDGKLDTGEWTDAKIYEIKYEINPGDNVPAPVKTEVYVKYDDNNLYFGFRAFDPNPEKIRARYSDRDVIFGDDLVGIMLDTFNGQRRAYEFVCNPYGVQQDFLYTQGVGEDVSWDTIWDSAGSILSDGYFVEIAIPFNSITFPSKVENQEWGISLYRIYPREYRSRLYSHPNDRNDSCFICQFDKLTGIEDIKPGRNLEITPSMVVSNAKERPGFDQPMNGSETNSNIGVNLRWGPTSNILVNATYNPDFSQIEADSAQLTVNRRFALYFNEKRPFFLEEGDNFMTEENVLYTRTIADPSFGVKVTGKMNRTHFGSFYAEDTITNFIEPSSTNSSLESYSHNSNNTSLRVKQDIFENSFVGMIVTDRRGGEYYNTVSGVDGRFNLTKQDTVNFQYLKSRRKNPVSDESNIFNGNELEGDDMFFSYSHRGRNWKWGSYYLDRDNDFRADMGFINQVGIKVKGVEIGYTYYSEKSSFYSQIQNNLEYNKITDFNGELLEDEFQYTFSSQLAKQSYFNFELEKRREVYQNKQYDDLKEYIAWVGSKPIKYLTFDLTYRIGDYIDYSANRLGDGNTFGLSMEVKPSKHIKVDFDYTIENLDVNNQKLYSAKVIQSTFVYNFGTRMFLRAILQDVKVDRNKDNYLSEVEAKNEDFIGQLLFSYKINPRTLCYLGYSSGSYGNEKYNLQAFNKTIFFKISYAFGL